jgi:hypothetical protein
MFLKTTHVAGISRRPVASLLSALILSITATQAKADDIRVLSGGGPQAALRAVIPEFEKETGHRVQPSLRARQRDPAKTRRWRKNRPDFSSHSPNRGGRESCPITT